MAGIDASRAFTAIFRPSFLLIILRGLSALTARSALRLLKEDVSSLLLDINNQKSIIDITTTQKSSTFHQFIIYPFIPLYGLEKNPIAIILSIASTQNKNVKNKSIAANALVYGASGSFRGLSRHKITELRRMNVITTISKYFEYLIAFSDVTMIPS
jgi:hypothetical protein